MNLETSSLRSLPGLALGDWEGTAPAPSVPMSLPAQPFTLWLSPDAWPMPALKLPGNAHTLWLDPEKWPRPLLRLPGAAFTVWLDEGRWPSVKPAVPEEVAEPVPVSVLPATEPEPFAGEAFPIIPEPPALVEPPAAAELPVVAELVTAEPEPPPVTLEIPVMPEPPVEVEPVIVVESAAAPPEAEEPPAPVGPPVIPNVSSVIPPVSAMSTPIVLPANHSFTLWTTAAALAGPAKPAVVAAVSATAAKPRLRLPGQPFTLWTQPGRVEPVSMRNGTASFSGKTVVAMPEGTSFLQRWGQFAAGLVVAGVLFLAYLSQKDQRVKAEEERDTLRKNMDVEIAAANAAAKKAADESQKTASELKAKEADFTGELAKLKTDYNNAVADSKAKTTLADEKTAALDKAKKDLSDVAKDFAAKEAVLQKNASTAAEELSKAKRATGEELSKAKETIARLEEEKAVAVKDATNAQADRDVLKVEVDKLRKQMEGKNRPPNVPEA